MKTSYKFVVLVILACILSILIYYHVDKFKQATIVEDILVTQNNKELEFLNDTNYPFDNPKVVINPYGISPLTALIIFETNDLTAPTITIKGKDEHTTITHTFTPNTKHILPIYGLYADSENEVILKVNNETKKITIKTDKLPDDLVLPTKVTSNKDKLNNELYFFTPSSQGYTVAYDINGDVRWYLNDNFIWDIQRLENGHLLLSSNRLINSPYYMTGLVEMDLLGKIYYEYSLKGGYHHDVYEMEDGNLLIASDNFDNGTVEDYVVLLERKTGKILKEYDLTEILPMETGQSENWSVYDWFHNNSVWYDEKTNSITLSGRHQDAVINIDFNTGELNWIIGDSTNWLDDYKKYFFTPIGDDFEWQWSQHSAMILPNGNVFIFDNGNNRSKIKEEYISADNNYSRGVIYKINTDDMTIEQVWEYGKKRGSDYYSPYISDVDYLDNNHYIIHSGGHSIIDGQVNNNPAGMGNIDSLNSITTEILNNKVIFEIELPTNNYRVEKLDLYANDKFQSGMGIRLGSLGETKTNPKKPLLLFSKEDKNLFETYDLDITKEVDRLVIKGTYKKDDKVQIILDNMFDKLVYDVRISKKPYTALCVDLFTEEEKENGISVTKYINDEGISGRYHIYIKINGTVYDINQYVVF